VRTAKPRMTKQSPCLRVRALVTVLVGCAAVLGGAADAAADTVVFSSTGAEQTFVVPAGVSKVTVVAVGAPGGGACAGVPTGGVGARMTGDMTVAAGQVLFVEVGGKATFTTTSPYYGVGGFNGGADGGTPNGHGGGGASDLRTVARSKSGSLSSRLLIAAGGGGTGAFTGCASYGDTGGNAGEDGGGGIRAGKAGSASSGGAGGSGAGGADGSSGALGAGGKGGNSTSAGVGGGGGGGGYYGGGGGGGAEPGAPGGGGGGSSYAAPAISGVSTDLDASRIPSITLTYTAGSPPGGGPTPVNPPHLAGGSFAGRALVSARGVFTLKTPEIDCTGAGPDCTVSTTVTAKLEATANAAAKRNVKVGGRTFTVATGTKGKIGSRLSAKGRRLLKRLGRLRATVKVTVVRGGEVASGTVRVRLKRKR
jgi:glycine rich protein